MTKLEKQKQQAREEYRKNGRGLFAKGAGLDVDFL